MQDQRKDVGPVGGSSSIAAQATEKVTPTCKDFIAQVQSTLNKLGSGNVDTLEAEIRELPITNIVDLQQVVDMIFRKAVEDSGLSQACAGMCQILTGLQVPADGKSSDGQQFVNIRTFLVGRCQAEFGKHKAFELGRELILGEINRMQNCELMSDYLSVYLTIERKVQTTFFRLIRFYGVLFNDRLLTTSLMHLCICHLLLSGVEGSVECLCRLLTTIGKTLESKSGSLGNANDLTEYFTRIAAILRQSEGVSPELRVAIQELMELRKRKWVPGADSSISQPTMHTHAEKAATNTTSIKEIECSLSAKENTHVLLKDTSVMDVIVDFGACASELATEETAPHAPEQTCDVSTPSTAYKHQPPPKRNSQQGKPVSKSGTLNVIHMSPSLREDVKLHTTENAWKPSFMNRDQLYKSVRGVLNKLTPQKFDTLVSQVQGLPIDSSEKLQGVVNLVFEKAVNDPLYSVVYAQMCKVLSGMQVPAERKTPEDPEYVNFRKLIVNRCQAEFEKNTEAELNKDAKLKEINLMTDVEKKRELMLVFEKEKKGICMKPVGNIRFIGELFKLQMFTTSIMHRCIRHLLTAGDEESLECLCTLLTIIGKDLEIKAQNAGDLGQYFTRMREITVKRGQGSVSSRVRFMLQDVIELRQSNWIPRRDDANPKTMDQIRNEAEREFMDMNLPAPQTPGRRQNDRGGGRDMGDRGRKGGSQRGDSSQQGSDGWTDVPARTNRNIAIDSSKFKVNKMEIDTVPLGSTNQFSKWSRGQGCAIKSDEKKPAQGYNYPYNVLQDTQSGDDKRGSMPPSFLPRPSSRDNSSRRSGMGSQPGSVSNLEYTVGAVSSSQPTTNLSQMTMDQIREKILTFLNAEQLPSATTSFEQVCDWINANVGDRVKEPPFIRALMTAICESAIYLQPNTTTWKLNENILHQHQHLLLRYVDNKEDLELECIYAVQSLINQLEHPQGLLCAIFQDLYDNSIFSYDAFIAWETSKDPSEQLGKDAALKSLKSFYKSERK